MTSTSTYTIASNGYTQSATTPQIVAQGVPQQPQPEPQKTIHILVTADRTDKLKARIMRTVGESFEAQLKFLGLFLADERGVYLPAAEALAFLDDLTMEEIRPLVEEITGKMQEASAPKK